MKSGKKQNNATQDLYNSVKLPNMVSYWLYFGQFMLTQSVWIYALGIPLYFLIKKLIDKGVIKN